MFERYDSSELLALIEGELEPATAEALRLRLAGDPRALEVLKAMSADRAMIRSLAEPPLPLDFIAAIEPMLSRPMLMEPVAEALAASPGQFRRQYRRRTRAQRVSRLAVAAIVLFAASAGVVAVALNWGNLRALAPQNDSVAVQGSANESSRGGVGASGISSTDSILSSRSNLKASDDLESEVLHHHVRPGAASANGETAPHVEDFHVEPRSSPPWTAVNFAVVVRSDDPKVAEERMGALLSAIGERAALVRNFSYVHAQELAESYRIAHAEPAPDRGDQGRRVLSTVPMPAPGAAGLNETHMSRSELAMLAQRVRAELEQGDSTANAMPAEMENPLLAGSGDVSPSLETQLEFSSRGATHTIAIPASQLISLIESLALSDPAVASTMLTMLPDHAIDQRSSLADAASNSSMLSWMTDGPLIRGAMERLNHVRGDAIVYLPVIVR